MAGGYECLKPPDPPIANFPAKLFPALQKLMLPLTSTLRQKQTQFESSSSNRGDVTSKLSRHCGHSLPPLREFDQQLGLLLGPFAGFCRPHCCARSEDRMLHQLEPQFGRDEGALHFAMRPLSVRPSAEHTITKTVLLNSSGCNCLKQRELLGLPAAALNRTRISPRTQFHHYGPQQISEEPERTMARNFGVPRPMNWRDPAPVWPTWLMTFAIRVGIATRRGFPHRR
jgi:hypothetical protein